MEKIRTFLKGRMGSLLLCVLQILVGVLLLINPMGFTSGIIIGAGWVMAALGMVSVVRYFMMNPEEAANSQLLFRGLALGMAGAILK